MSVILKSYAPWTLAAIAAEMELHSKVARLCLQTAKRPGVGEGEREKDREGGAEEGMKQGAKARQVYGLRTAVYSPFL